MENIRKYFEYITELSKAGKNIIVDNAIDRCVENIVNKLLSLPKEKDEMYLKAIQKHILSETDRALDRYAYENEDTCIFEIEHKHSELFEEWIKGIITNPHNGERLNKKDVYDLIDADSFLTISTMWEESTAKKANDDDNDGELSDYKHIVGIDINTGNVDMIFSRYLCYISDLVSNIQFIIRLYYIDFHITSYSSENVNKSLYNNDEEIERKYIKEIAPKQKKQFSSIMTQEQLSTMFRLLREYGIIDRSMNNTQLAKVITHLAGGSCQTTRSCLGGQKAEHINMTLTNKDQAKQIQDTLSNIITQIEDEKNDI